MLRQRPYNIIALALAILTLLPLLALSAERNKIEFTLLRIDRSDPKRPLGVFTFRQNVYRSLPVYGFDKPTNGHFYPSFINYQVLTEGEWRSISITYPHCGTCDLTYPLRSGQNYTFNVVLSDFTNATERARIGIRTERQAHWSDSFRLADYD